ncbi:MAG TPA: glutathione S-transferase family protein [Gammaproteobacteria bacterium]|nr:glutathione S-transferase family protein [Gammaproteobacteria bacterium]
MDETLVVYGAEYSTYVRSVRLCCEEKGVVYQFQERLSRADRLTLNNPFKKVPIIRHGDFVLYESAAICRYIDRRFDGPSLSPAPVAELALMDQWISAANCYFDPAFIRRFVLVHAFPSGKDGQVDETKLEAALPEVVQQLEIIENALCASDYFSGDKPGIADYLIIPMLDYLARGRGGYLFDKLSQTNRYLERLRKRPSGQKILV